MAATAEKLLLITLFPNSFADKFQLRFDETAVGAFQLKVFDRHNRLMCDETFIDASQHKSEF
ncbi:MAG: hypothetical protein ACJAU0_000796 [Flavobacteriales bacterium]